MESQSQTEQMEEACRRQMEELRIEDLQRQLDEVRKDRDHLQQQLAAAAPPPGGIPRCLGRGVVSRPTLGAKAELSSPSATTAANSVFSGGDFVLARLPLAARALGLSVDAAVADAFQAVFAPGAKAAAWYRNVAKGVLPTFAEARYGGGHSAQQLFGREGMVSQRFTLAPRCAPGLPVRSRLTAERPHRPAYNGEVTCSSVAAAAGQQPQPWLERAVQCVTMDMIRSFVPAAAADAPAEGGVGSEATRPARLLRFFELPPVGFALVAFSHVGYLVAVEWVGRVFVSPVSAPFVVGSEEHVAAAEALPDVAYRPPVELPDDDPAWVAARPRPHTPSAAPRTWWSLVPALARPGSAAAGGGSGSTFRKVLRWDARTPEQWRSLYAAYDALGAVGVGAVGDLPPPLVGGVRLLFGHHVALVETAGLADCEPCTDAELFVDGSPILAAAADGVATLAVRYGLLYTDLRGPNVMRPRPRSGSGSAPAEGGVARAPPGGHGDAGTAVARRQPPPPPPAAWLVDYDDCLPLAPAAGPVRDADTYFERLMLTAAADMAGTFAWWYCSGELPTCVREALTAAFERVTAAEPHGWGGPGSPAHA